MPIFNDLVVSVCCGLILGILVGTLFAWRTAFARLKDITLELYAMKEDLTALITALIEEWNRRANND